MVLEKVKNIVAVQFNVDIKDLDLETSFRDTLNADSLDLVELVMAIEDEFDLEVEDDEMESINTIGDVVKNVENALDNK